VDDGLYHYDPRAHELELRRTGAHGDVLARALLDQRYVGLANIVVVIVGVPGRTMWKYGLRGYRFMLLDAGHLAQNLCLVATALGLGAISLGGFFDHELHDALNLVEGEDPIYVVAVGHEAGPTG
jgi:SagB-type dehydrogenase family enzyme